MQSNNEAVFWRHDTFLGVCEAIGRDFGFNPDWLRALFAVSLLFAPVLVLSIYVGIGVLVFASRFFFPSTRKVETVEAPAQPLQADNDAAAGDIAIAA